MCGIIFAFQPNLELGELREAGEQALSALSHRGPDDSGIRGDFPWIIGHRRLSIIDLVASRQPMADPSGRYLLSYNGEVYNYKELRCQLKSEWGFLTDGDTEVLLAGLILKGEVFLKKMEGMWALALWDSETNTLLLSRDRMGKKPLYFHNAREGFSCASELPALRCLSADPWDEDLDSTADYLRYGYYLPGTTAFEGVREILPGHVATWRPGTVISQRPYWSLAVNGFSGNVKTARKQLYETMVQSVQKRLVADVEVGAFLSGGVDSSLIVAILAKELGVHPKTFTIGFQETSYDERSYARLVANHCDTEHFEACLDRWDPDQLKRLVLRHVGQPFADSSLLPTALVSKETAKRVKVALSGDGGDELFSGYQRYQARSILRWYTRLPKGLRRNIGKLVRLLPEPMSHHSSSVLKKAHLFQDVTDRIADETPYTAPLIYSSRAYSLLAPDLAGRGHPPPTLPQQTQPDDIQAMMIADTLIYLPQDILLKVDRASMAHSLESRAPFLDHRLVELAFSLPRSWHRRGFGGKRLLREAFGAMLPESVWQRRKQGFAVPVHEWFRGEIGDYLYRLLRSSDSPLQTDFVETLLEEHRLRVRDHGYRLWNIYVYLLWRSTLRTS